MSPKRSQNSDEKLWNAFHVLGDVISEIEETKFTMELKKNIEISEEQLNKIIALKKQIEEETEQIIIPPFKKIMVKLKGRRTEKLSMELKELAEIQKLCKELKSGTGTAEDQNKLDSTVKKLVEGYSRELTSYTPNSNPIMLYTAVIGAGLAVGLVASTVLEHTTRLSMLAIISIATVSAFVAGYVTYKTIEPNTQINESKEIQIKSTRHSLP